MDSGTGEGARPRAPDGLSAEALRRNLDGIPSTLHGMRSPLGEPVRSESVAGMDMLNDMFQRQARRLESQLYQRAQDQRTIEMTQRQAQLAQQQVRQLEQHHLEQAARISQGSKSLQRLQDLIRESLQANSESLGVCEALERDVASLRQALEREAPAELAKLRMRCEEVNPTDALRARAQGLEKALGDTERTALQQIGATPLQSVAMSSDCNPLHDLSAVADYASKATVGARCGDSSWPSESMASAPASSSAPAAHHASASAYAPSPSFSHHSTAYSVPPGYSPTAFSRDQSMQPMTLSRDPSFMRDDS